MNIKDFVDIIVGTIALIGFVYRLSSLESKIYQEIDSSEDKVNEKINNLSNKFQVQQADYLAKKELQDYLIHSVQQSLNHKFNRCWDEIKELKSNKE